MTYAASVWCSISNTTILKLQRTQNRCLRLILNQNKYARIKDMHHQANIETVRTLTNKQAETFFRTQIKKSNLTTYIADHRIHKSTPIHKLLHQTMPIFLENLN